MHSSLGIGNAISRVILSLPWSVLYKPASFSIFFKADDFNKRGLYDAGTWVWVESHQKAEYTHWAETQPNNHGDEDCVLKTSERSHEVSH